MFNRELRGTVGAVYVQADTTVDYTDEGDRCWAVMVGSTPIIFAEELADGTIGVMDTQGKHLMSVSDPTEIEKWTGGSTWTYSDEAVRRTGT